MASCAIIPDILSWIKNLPPIHEWQTISNSLCLCLCSSTSSQPSLNLSISKNNQNTLSLSIVANFSLPISLWTSKPLKINNNNPNPNPKPLSDQQTLLSLLVNFIEEVLHYGSNNNNNSNNSTTMFLKIESSNAVEETFNTAFLTLFFLVCIYEAPSDLRQGCLNTVKNNLADCRSRRATKSLMKLLGLNLEEQWMRSINLAVTNWIVELQANRRPCALKTPSPLFSYSLSTLGMWKVQLYCPVIAMSFEESSNPSSGGGGADDPRLKFSLDYHQLQGVIQLNYKIVPQEMWVGVMVNIDNIRCDVIKLVNETLMSERGVGSSEKHFPSRISLQLTPTTQTNVLSVSVSKSSENPVREIGLEKSIEAGFDPPNPYLGLKVSAAETVTTSLRPWKFEESVQGYSASLSWYLHDSVDGREVFSSRPSRLSLMNPRAWFKHRYSSAHRPFTRQGGVVFAGDEYGERVVWKVDRAAMGRAMEWEVKGWIWLTYWPNKHRTSYTETRRLEFREVLSLVIS